MSCRAPPLFLALRHFVVVKHLILAHTAFEVTRTLLARIVVSKVDLHVLHLARVIPVPLPSFMKKREVYKR